MMKFVGQKEEQLTGPFDIEITGTNKKTITLKSSSALIMSIDYQSDDSIMEVPLCTIMLNDGAESLSTLSIAFVRALGGSLGTCLRKNLPTADKIEVGVELAKSFLDGFAETAQIHDPTNSNGNGRLH